MEKKIIILLEVLFVVGALGFYMVKELIPEYRDSHGSSDSFLNAKHYHNMVEWNVDDAVHFSTVFNSDQKIIHIFFFSKTSTCLYNQNIEGNALEDGIKKVVQILIQQDYLKDDSTVFLTRYGDSSYDSYLESVKKCFKEYDLSSFIMEKENTIAELSEELHLAPSTNDKNILRNIDFYSKEFVRAYKNEQRENESVEDFPESTARHYANTVYKMLEKKMVEENITNSVKADVLSSIKIDTEEEYLYYLTQNSWYYVLEGKIYAFIEFDDSYEIVSFCYLGSIDQAREGQCP